MSSRTPPPGTGEYVPAAVGPAGGSAPDIQLPPVPAPVNPPPIEAQPAAGQRELRIWRATYTDPANPTRITPQQVNPAQLNTGRPTLIVLPGIYTHHASDFRAAGMAIDVGMIGGREAAASGAIDVMTISYPDLQTNPQAFREYALNGPDGHSQLTRDLSRAVLGNVRDYNSMTPAERQTEIARMQRELRTKVFTGMSMGTYVAEGLQHAMVAELTQRGYPPEVISRDIMPNLKIVGYSEVGIHHRGGRAPTGATAFHIANHNDTVGTQGITSHGAQTTNVNRGSGTTLARVGPNEAVLMVTMPTDTPYYTEKPFTGNRAGQNIVMRDGIPMVRVVNQRNTNGHSPVQFREPTTPIDMIDGRTSYTEATGHAAANAARGMMHDAIAVSRQTPGQPLPPVPSITDLVITPHGGVGYQGPPQHDPATRGMERAGYSDYMRSVMPGEQVHPLQAVMSGDLSRTTPMARQAAETLRSFTWTQVGTPDGDVLRMDISRLTPEAQVRITAALREMGVGYNKIGNTIEVPYFNAPEPMLMNVVVGPTARGTRSGSSLNLGVPPVAPGANDTPLEVPFARVEGPPRTGTGTGNNTGAPRTGGQPAPPLVAPPGTTAPIPFDGQLVTERSAIHETLVRIRDGNIRVTPSTVPGQLPSMDIDRIALARHMEALQQRYPDGRWLDVPLIADDPRSTPRHLYDDISRNASAANDQLVDRAQRQRAAGEPITITDQERMTRSARTGAINLVRTLHSIDVDARAAAAGVTPRAPSPVAGPPSSEVALGVLPEETPPNAGRRSNAGALPAGRTEVAPGRPAEGGAAAPGDRTAVAPGRAPEAPGVAAAGDRTAVAPGRAPDAPAGVAAPGDRTAVVPGRNPTPPGVAPAATVTPPPAPPGTQTGSLSSEVNLGGPLPPGADPVARRSDIPRTTPGATPQGVTPQPTVVPQEAGAPTRTTVAPTAGPPRGAIDGAGAAGALALALGVPGTVQHWDQLNEYERRKAAALTGTGAAALTGEGVAALTGPNASRGTRAATGILRSIGWFANPTLIVAGVDQWNGAGRRTSVAAAAADRTLGGLTVGLGAHGTATGLGSAAQWLRGRAAVPTPTTVPLANFRPAGVGTATGAANLGLIAFTIADEGGALLGRERFFDAIDRTEVAVQEDQVSQEQMQRRMQTTGVTRSYVNGLPPRLNDYQHGTTVGEMLVSNGIATREELDRLPPQELFDRLGRLQERLTENFNRDYKPALDAYIASPSLPGQFVDASLFIASAVTSSGGVERFNEARNQQLQLLNTITQIRSVRNEVGRYGVDRQTGQERALTDPLPAGVRTMEMRHRDFEALRRNDPALATAIEQIAPLYRKLAAGQALTDAERTQLDTMVSERQTAQLQAMQRMHAAHLAGAPGGMSGTDFLREQRRRLEAAGIAGTPLGNMLMLNNPEQLEAIIVSNNIQGAREVAATGSTQLTNLNMREDFGVTPPTITTILSDRNIQADATQIINIPNRGQFVRIDAMPGDPHNRANAWAQSLAAQGFSVERSSSGIIVPLAELQSYMSPQTLALMRSREQHVTAADADLEIAGAEAWRAQATTRLRLPVAEQQRINPDVPVVREAAAAEAALRSENTAYAARQQQMAAELETRRREAESLRNATSPADIARRTEAQHFVDNYQNLVEYERASHGVRLRERYHDLAERYTALEAFERTDTRSLEAINAGRGQQPMDATARAGYAERFENQLRQLGRARDFAGELAFRRARMGIDPSGSGQPATRQMLDEYYRNSGPALLMNPQLDAYHASFQQNYAIPAPLRGAHNPEALAIPENIREMARLAWPELTDRQRDQRISELLPQWENIKPDAHARFAASDQGRSTRVQEMLTTIDRQENPPRAVTTRSSFGNLENVTHPTTGAQYRNVPVLNEAGRNDIVDLAIALRERLNTPGLSAEDRSKYEFHLRSLREFTRSQTQYTRALPDVTRAWSEVDAMIRDDSALARTAAARLDRDGDRRITAADFDRNGDGRISGPEETQALQRAARSMAAMLGDDARAAVAEIRRIAEQSNVVLTDIGTTPPAPPTTMPTVPTGPVTRR